MKTKFRFKYDGDWTQWFDIEQIEVIMNINNIEAFEVIEYLTKEQFKQYLFDKGINL